MPVQLDGTVITDEDIALTFSPPNGNGLHAKLVQIMAAIGYIEKRGEMKKDGKTQYNYIKGSDMYDAIRPLFVQHGLSILPRIIKIDHWEKQSSSGGITNMVMLHARFQITDKATHELDFLEGVGGGMDYGDKAPQKALGAALKYGLKAAFLISDDDADADAPLKEEKTRKTSDKRKFELVKGTVTEFRAIGKNTIWLRVNNADTWIRSVNAETSAQLRNAQDCLIEVTAYWDKEKSKTGEAKDVMTVTRVAGVWESKPKTGWIAQQGAEDENQEDEHLSPDMDPTLFAKGKKK